MYFLWGHVTVYTWQKYATSLIKEIFFFNYSFWWHKINWHFLQYITIADKWFKKNWLQQCFLTIILSSIITVMWLIKVTCSRSAENYYLVQAKTYTKLTAQIKQKQVNKKYCFIFRLTKWQFSNILIPTYFNTKPYWY